MLLCARPPLMRPGHNLFCAARSLTGRHVSFGLWPGLCQYARRPAGSQIPQTVWCLCLIVANGHRFFRRTHPLCVLRTRRS